MKKENSLSVRLLSVASMVTEGTIVADVGTDHGYVPIYLVKNNICKKAYACDVNEGPLKKAGEHIVSEQLEDRIKTVLSDGLASLKGCEVDSVVIAGMGGLLVSRLLNMADVENISELILSPHRDIETVRKTVLDKGFFIADEKIIKDAGKYYFIIKAINKRLYKERSLKGDYVYSFDNVTDEVYDEFDLYFGKRLFEKKDLMFAEYLEKNVDKYSEIVQRIGENSDKRNDDSGKQKLNEILIKYKNALEKLR